MPLRVAHLLPCTEAEGPGRRTAIWVQGCRIRCPGCCNPELFGVSGGEPWSTGALVHAARVAGTEGVTLLGGEPLDQPEAVTDLSRAAREAGLSVLLYSGYARDEVCARAPDLLQWVDVLVDGPYDEQQPEGAARRWIGSRNQGLHFLTDRYGPADFQGANTVELRLRGGVLTVNGWPAPGTLRR